MRQTRAKLKWYKISWKWHRNSSIGDLVKDSYFSSHKGNVKIMIWNSNNSSSHGEHAKAARFYFATINTDKEQQFHKIMSEGNRNGPHKKTIVHTEKNSIHGCSENSVSEEALFAVLHGRYIISLNISAKPTFILRKSKGNSYSQTCMIFRSG